MSKFILSFLLFFSLLSPSAAKSSPPDISRSIEAIEMTWDDSEGHYDVSGCTAGYIGQDLWLTASHCFAPDSEDQKNMAFFIEKQKVDIVYLDPISDVAIIHAFAPKDDIPLKLRLYGVELGETVYSEGFPFGGYVPFYVSGEVMNLDFKVEDRQYTVTSMMVSPGMSGSPVVDKNGALLGVMQAGWGQTSWKTISGFTPYKYMGPLEKFFKVEGIDLQIER